MLHLSIQGAYSFSNEPLGTPLRCSQSDSAYSFSNERGTITASFNKREHPPVTYCSQRADGSFQFGYQAVSLLSDEDQEFLHISLSHNGSLTVVRDTRATLPLFYGYCDGLFVLSNSYAYATSSLPKLTLNHGDIVKSIAPLPGEQPTLWEEVKVLGCNETLSFKPGKPPIKSKLKSRAWGISSRAPRSDPKEFFPRLEHVLKNTLNAYAIPGELLGFELSGGLDSSTLPLFMTAHYPDTPWMGASITYPDVFGVTQTRKLQSIFERAPQATLQVITPDEAALALAAPFTNPHPVPIFPHEGSPLEPLEKIAGVFKNAGVKTVFHGMGGDELFEHTVDIEQQLSIGTLAAQDRQMHIAG
ncbi:MAG: asparagine synthase-related protein, partial [Patescibacteria group bacterium]